MVLAEALHTAQIEEVAAQIVPFVTLLVILAGRQEAMDKAVAARLCTELIIKGRQPAMLATAAYTSQATSKTQRLGIVCPHSGTSAMPSLGYLDSALRDVLASLLGKARTEVRLPSLGISDIASVPGADLISEIERCDTVIVHGSEALDVDLIPSGVLDLSLGGVFFVFVNTSPQVYVQNLTPVSGADVRLLRMLAGCVSGRPSAEPTDFPHGQITDISSFLEHWLVIEARENQLSRSFRMVTDVQVNTALPYDLHVLKPVVEPLLRSVSPPGRARTEGRDNSSDGCRSPTYALARSMLRLLRHCEALNTLPIPDSSVPSGLV